MKLALELLKQTAHGLLTKSSAMLDRLTPILQEAVLSDSYIHFDETYHTIIDNQAVGGSRK